MHVSDPSVPAPGLRLARGALPGALRRRSHVGPGRGAARRTGPLFGSLAAYVYRHTGELYRFVLIGAVLAAANLAVLYGLRHWLHLSDAVAVAIMYALGVVPHFAAHRRITYHAQDQPLPPQGWRYALMLLWNFALMQAIVALASRMSLSPYFAVMASTGCTMMLNFVMMTHIVFVRRRAS